jgi:hypothetical protein
MNITNALVETTYKAIIDFPANFKFTLLESEHTEFFNKLLIERIEISLHTKKTHEEHWESVMDIIDLQLNMRGLNRSSLGLVRNDFKKEFNSIFVQLDDTVNS